MFNIDNVLKNRLQNWVIPILPKEIKTESLDKQLSYAFNLYAMSTILDIDLSDTFQWITERTGGQWHRRNLYQ